MGLPIPFLRQPERAHRKREVHGCQTGLGALAGSFFGHLVHTALPGPTGLEATFALVGMAALFTAIVRAPITGIVLVVEMTGSYQNMLALFAACVTAYVVAEVLKNPPVYEMLLERDEARGGLSRLKTARIFKSLAN